MWHMFHALYYLLWMLAIVVAGEESSNFGIGYHIGDPNRMFEDFRAMTPYFAVVRTFSIQAGSVNAIDIAAQAGLKIAAGIPLEQSRFELDLKAAIEGSKRHPDTVQVVYVGNEDLMHGVGEDFIISKIQQVKERFRSNGLAKIPIGTVQIDGSLLQYPRLKEVCDQIGVNIHPFFSNGIPIDNFIARYNNVKSVYPNVQVTEVGWPSDGGKSPTGQVADLKTLVSFYKSLYEWQQIVKSTTPYWFMFQDVPAKGGFEAYFGLMDANGKWKFDMTQFAVQNSSQSNSKPSSRAAHTQTKINPSVKKLFAITNELGVALGIKKNELVTSELAWTLVKVEDSTLRIRNQCLGADEGGTRPRVILSVCKPSQDDQKWNIDPVKKLIQHQKTQKCLDIDSDKNQVGLAKCNDSSPYQSLELIVRNERAICSTLEHNIDYIGNDIQSVPALKPKSCCILCWRKLKCTHFSWRDGQCWLKSIKEKKSKPEDGVESSSLLNE